MLVCYVFNNCKDSVKEGFGFSIRGDVVDILARKVHQ